MPRDPDPPPLPPASLVGDARLEAAVAAGPATFAALRHPNYRLWFAGQLVSLLGTWMQSTALGYFAFELTHSAVFLGTVAFATGLPSWLFMLWGGVAADRVPRRALLAATQVAMMLLAAGLATLTFAGWIQPWHLPAFGFALGTVNAFDAPARQSFVLELVGRQHLGNAIALNSMMFNSATAVGPAVGGVVYAAVGPAWCFLANSVSFVGVLVALALMRLPPWAPRERSSPMAELREGLRYVATHRSIRVLIALVGVATVFGFATLSLLPAWAVRVLGGDATTNGLLQSARGVGALATALALASLESGRRRGPIVSVGIVALPLSLLAFAAMRSVPLALAAMIAVGASLVLVYNLCNTLVQTLAEDDLRGRVMGIYTLTFFGLFPLGSLLAGALADTIGEPLTFAAGAAVLLVVAGVAQLIDPPLRRIDRPATTA